MLNNPYSLAYLVAEHQRELRRIAASANVCGSADPGAGLLAAAKRIVRRALARRVSGEHGRDLTGEEGLRSSSPVGIAR